MVDVAIIGGGPAALSAAIYCGRAGLETVVFEKTSFGGELSRIDTIANYPGFTGKSETLIKHFREQAEATGAKLSYGECQSIELGENNEGFRLKIDDETVEARAVLVATGSQPKPLGFEITPSVSYCALCDADFAKGKRVAVVGGGNSAAQEALYLSPLVRELDLITHSKLKADHALKTKLLGHSNITIRESVEPIPELLNQYDYVFVFIGNLPATSFLKTIDVNLLDERGYVITGEAAGSFERPSTKFLNLKISFTSDTPSPHETAIPGLFAAGDVRQGCPKQVVCAAGDGAAAAIEIIQYLQK